MSVEKLVEHFSALEDPRCSGKVEHRLIDILVIAVCAVIACAESWDDIALYGRNKLGWLRSFLTLAHGIPSHDTFRRVFMLIDPDAFEACFSAWAQSFAEVFHREVVAIDGKTLRRSFDRGRAQAPLHLVSAWASEQGLVLGQREVDGKSNEITRVHASCWVWLLIEECAGRFGFDATGDEQHDQRVGSVLYGAGGSPRDEPVRSPAHRHPRDRDLCGDRLRRELGGHRALWAKQEGLARDLPGPAEWHPLPRHLPARVHADRPRRLRGVLLPMGAGLGAWGRA